MKKPLSLPSSATIIIAILLSPLMLSGCSGSTSNQANSTGTEQAVSSSSTQMVHLEIAAAGDSTSSSPLFGAGNYNAQAATLFRSKYADLPQNTSSTSTNGNVSGSFQNGSSTSANGSSSNANGNIPGTSVARSTNPSAYSYISGCDYSLLGATGVTAQCGNPGWTFPQLIGGRCPVTACIINVQQTGKQPFGPL